MRINFGETKFFLELLASLLELLGLNCQLASVDTQFLLSVESPAVFLLDGVPVVLFAHTGTTVVLGHPQRGLVRESVETLQAALRASLRFASPRRIASTPRESLRMELVHAVAQ